MEFTCNPFQVEHFYVRVLHSSSVNLSILFNQSGKQCGSAGFFRSLGKFHTLIRKVWTSFLVIFYISPTKGKRETYNLMYCIRCRSCGCLHPHPLVFLLALYFLKLWVNFDQTHIETLLGEKKESIRF